MVNDDDIEIDNVGDTPLRSDDVAYRTITTIIIIIIVVSIATTTIISSVHRTRSRPSLSSRADVVYDGGAMPHGGDDVGNVFIQSEASMIASFHS